MTAHDAELLDPGRASRSKKRRRSAQRSVSDPFIVVRGAAAFYLETRIEKLTPLCNTLRRFKKDRYPPPAAPAPSAQTQQMSGRAKLLQDVEGACCDPPPLVLGDKGRRHLRQLPSETYVYRMGKKEIPTPRRELVQTPRGRKWLPGPQSSRDNPTPLKAEGIRKVPGGAERSGYNQPQLSEFPRKKHFPLSITAARSKEELCLEVALGKKKKIWQKIDRRNGIPVAAPGDNAFYDATCSPGFFQRSSSEAEMKLFKRLCGIGEPALVDGTLGYSTRFTPQALTPAQRRQEKLRNEEMLEVKKLTESVGEGGESIVSWEERTGCHTEAPPRNKKNQQEQEQEAAPTTTITPSNLQQ